MVGLFMNSPRLMRNTSTYKRVVKGATWEGYGKKKKQLLAVLKYLGKWWLPEEG